MRIAYFDCFAGCSGNMVLGALVDLGCPVDNLRRYLETLHLDGWALTIDHVIRNGFGATLVEVRQPPSPSELPNSGSRVTDGGVQEPGDGRETHGSVARGDQFGRGGNAHGEHYARADHGGADAADDPTARYLVHRDDQPARHLPEILSLIDSSGIPPRAKDIARRIFVRLGEAEALVHRTAPERVHFHEVGAVDSIVDIVGAATALELLGIDQVVVSAVNVGSGAVQVAHGLIPVPGPATAVLLTGVPIYHRGPAVELTTPTGAAILTTIADRFGPLPHMTLSGVGYGAGSRDLEIPNVLRVFLGDTPEKADGRLVDTVTVIEANIDDMSPQGFELAMERLFVGGALDVSLTPIGMKKNRPGLLLTVIATPEQADQLAGIVLRETTSLGVRLYDARRQCLPRSFQIVETPFGAIHMKVVSLGSETRAMPEYDDCKRASLTSGASLREVQLAAEQAWRHLVGEGD